MNQQKSFSKKFWWVFVVILIILFVIAFFIIRDLSNSHTSYNSKLPVCPTDLSGLFTARVMDKGVIQALTPLGNSNPPGHTFPVDHIYFEREANGQKYNVYVPGDGIILSISEEIGYDNSGNIFRASNSIAIGLCRGVEVEIATAGVVAPSLKAAIKDKNRDCKTVAGKHENEKELTVCTYNLEYNVKAGDLIALTDGDSLPEVWALDHNKKLSKEVDWERYGSKYYPYAFCFFDLYAGELKNEYYGLFGFMEKKGDVEAREKNSVNKEVDSKPRFIPRTIEPICGQTMQNITGTVQGDWFGLPKGSSTDVGENIGDLALIHDNFDPTIGKIVVAGNFAEAGVLMFMPTHEGTINREFSEVKADSKIYCYEQESGSGWWKEGKVLMHLLDDHHLKIEKQEGICGSNEAFSKPFNYDR